MRNFLEKKAFPSVLQSASQRRLFPQLEIGQTTENKTQDETKLEELEQLNESVIPVLRPSKFRRSLDSSCSSGQDEQHNSLSTDNSDESSQSSNEETDEVKIPLPNTTALRSKESSKANQVMQKASNDSMNSLSSDSRMSEIEPKPNSSDIQTPLTSFDNQSSSSLKEVSSYLSFNELQLLNKKPKKTA